MNPAQLATHRPVRIIPVLDLMNGQVVRAVGGRRELYRPVESRLTDSTDPLTVADVLLSTSGAGELYVADIDAIRHLRPRLGWVRQVAARGCRVLVDSGIRTAADANAVFAAGTSAVVAGTETVRGVGELKALCATFGPENVVLSLDLRNGRLIGDETVWGSGAEPLGVIGSAAAVGVRQVIVLDLARVGTGIGTGTEVLCGRIRAGFPDLELIAGGGVRTWDDVDRLGAVGVNGVLVASGLHDGTLTFPRPGS